MQVQGKANEPFNILDVTHVFLQTLQFLSKMKGHLKFNATENKNILNIFLYLLLLKIYNNTCKSKILCLFSYAKCVSSNPSAFSFAIFFTKFKVHQHVQLHQLCFLLWNPSHQNFLASIGINKHIIFKIFLTSIRKNKHIILRFVCFSTLNVGILLECQLVRFLFSSLISSFLDSIFSSLVEEPWPTIMPKPS